MSIGLIVLIGGYLLSYGLSSGIVVAVVNAYKHHFTSASAHFFFSFIVAAVFGLWLSITAFRANPTIMAITIPSVIAGSQLIFWTMEAWMNRKGDITEGDVTKVEKEVVTETQQVETPAA